MPEIRFPQPCGCVLSLDQFTSRWIGHWCEQHQLLLQPSLNRVMQQTDMLVRAKSRHRLAACVRGRGSLAQQAGYAPYRRDTLKPRPNGFDL